MENTGKLKISFQGKIFFTETCLVLHLELKTCSCVCRYLKKHVWSEIFNKLLNIKNIDHLPKMTHLKSLVDDEVWNMESELIHNIRTLSNLVKPSTVKRQSRKTGNKSHISSNASSIVNSSNSNTLDAAPAVETEATEV